MPVKSAAKASGENFSSACVYLKSTTKIRCNPETLSFALKRRKNAMVTFSAFEVAAKIRW